MNILELKLPNSSVVKFSLLVQKSMGSNLSWTCSKFFLVKSSISRKVIYLYELLSEVKEVIGTVTALAANKADESENVPNTKISAHTDPFVSVGLSHHKYRLKMIEALWKYKNN